MVEDVEIAERLTKVEDRAKSNTHQINELKPVVEEIHTISKTMVELITECKHTNESVVDIKQDVTKLSGKVEEIVATYTKLTDAERQEILDALNE